MVHIIGAPISTCTMRVLITLAELEVSDFTLYVPDMMKGEQKKPEHTAKQPFGVVPVLEDDGFTLFESRAICRYLALKYKDQGTKLLPDPKDIQANALFEQWASVELTNYEHYSSVIVMQNLFTKVHGNDSIPEIVNYFTKEFSAKLDIFDKILATQKFMGGKEFSLIDIFYIPYTHYMFQSGDGGLITDRPHLKAWWEIVSERPTVKELLAGAQMPKV